jgi:transcriptional antiterminator RfaH
LLKAQDNPPIVWPEELSISEFEGTWWVGHTKSRNEKALAHDLVSKGINYFLPMSWKVRRLRGRKIKSLLPLFSGYIFFCGGENERLEVLRTNRVANLIEVNDQGSFILELICIEHALKAGAPLEPHNYIQKGQRCRVTSGPLAGMEGIVVQVKGRLRLVLQIDMLGQAASVEVETDFIETVE